MIVVLYVWYWCNHVVLFLYSVGLLFMIWITIAAFRWVLYNVWCRFPPSAISQAFNSSWWRQVLKQRFTLYGFALLHDIETFAMLSQNPADPWKLSISATSTGYQNKLDPTNQAIPFDIDVMLFPKVKCHDDVIMMIVDKVKCHDVGWWPIFPDAPKELFYSDLISGEAYDQLPRMCRHSARGVQEMVRQTCEGWNEQDCKSKVDLIKKQKLSKWTRNDK